MDGLFSGFSPHLNNAKQQAEDIFNRTLDRSVRLAVTGLSRSGKTVFITSLINQLIHGLDNTRLPFFEIAGSGRLRGTKAQPQPDLHIPAFRYDLSMESLTAEQPRWPAPTSGISEIRLAIRYQSQHILYRHLTPINTLYLDIIDYPGEWLLDLPLLELSYETWSKQIATACREAPRDELSEPWRAYMKNLDVTKVESDSILRDASQLYTDFLYTCREPEHGLTLLQPGRFTMPGDLKGAPLLEFCPLLDEQIGISGSLSHDSFYMTMKRRYESYKEHVIRKFYREHFSKFDRQIVLADVLKTFNTGYASFTDMRAAIDLVLKSFHYGRSNLFNRLFGANIDKLLFAATKADHVTPNQLPNLERFLQLMLSEANNNAVFEGVKTDTLALASVKCTEAIQTKFQGQQISCIQGISKHSNEPIALFPGEVPTEIPVPADWVDGRFQFTSFLPPRLNQNSQASLPHIRMDKALQFLLGDKFI